MDAQYLVQMVDALGVQVVLAAHVHINMPKYSM
jgi:hypothetical protein